MDIVEIDYKNNKSAKIINDEDNKYRKEVFYKIPEVLDEEKN